MVRNLFFQVTAIAVLFQFISIDLIGQSKTEISGRVIDKSTGDAVPFVNVFFYGTQKGTTTDFEGRYAISTFEEFDSIVFSYIGYNKEILPLQNGHSYQLNIELTPETVNLDEVVVMSGENPAWGIIRQAVANKKLHDKRALESFEYDSYTKIELDIDNITDAVKKEKIFRDVSQVMDSIAQLKGDDGDTYVPVFLSEALSRYYVKNEPFSRRENVKKTKISGLAITDGSLTSQVVGSFYQEYNFYQNWLTILEKEFISPISDGWRMYYDYDIIDTVQLGQDSCYHLLVFPNRKGDLAFTGTIWITKDAYALKQVDVTIERSANVNFIEKIKIQQELAPTDDGPWLPLKTRVLIDVLQPSVNSPGFIAKFYNSIRDWQTNIPHPDRFYENQVLVEENATRKDEVFWEENRFDPLTEEEAKVYQLIDTLKSVPVVKFYTKVITTTSTGYYKAGKVDIGPYLYTWANNEIEGNRFVVGLRTNDELSKKVFFKGYLGYGTNDQKWKYSTRVGLILSRYPWRELGVQSKMDIEQVGLNSEKLADNYIFYASTKFGNLIEPYEHRQQRLYFETEIVKGLSQRMEFNYNQFDPLFNFAYYSDPDSPDSGTAQSFQSTSFKFTTHWGRDEAFIQNGNYRMSLGGRRAPVFDFTYIYGFDGMLGSDLNFHRFELQMNHKLRLGLIGTSNYRINAGYIIGQVPYPALENHVGNESFFFTTGAFNTMNYSEFVSDHFVSLRYYHSFQGLILNKIPVIKKLKWRLLGTANILYGGMREENIDLIPETDGNGNSLRRFNTLNELPFVELGYGIENIFRVLRVDFAHRVTYLDLPDVTGFQVKISMQLIL